MGEDKLKDLKEVLDLVGAGVKDAIAAAADGKFDISDLFKFSDLPGKLIPAIQGVENIPAELIHLEFSDAIDLVNYAMTQLNITSSKAIMVVNAALKLAVGVKDLIAAIKS